MTVTGPAPFWRIRMPELPSPAVSVEVRVPSVVTVTAPGPSCVMMMGALWLVMLLPFDKSTSIAPVVDVELIVSHPPLEELKPKVASPITLIFWFARPVMLCSCSPPFASSAPVQVHSPVISISVQVPASAGGVVASNAPSASADAPAKNGAKETRPFEVLLSRPPRMNSEGNFRVKMFTLLRSFEKHNSRNLESNLAFSFESSLDRGRGFGFKNHPRSNFFVR